MAHHNCAIRHAAFQPRTANAAVDIVAAVLPEHAAAIILKAGPGAPLFHFIGDVQVHHVFSPVLLGERAAAARASSSTVRLVHGPPCLIKSASSRRVWIKASL